MVTHLCVTPALLVTGGNADLLQVDHVIMARLPGEMLRRRRRRSAERSQSLLPDRSLG